MPLAFAAAISLTAPAWSIVHLRSGPLPGPAPAANTTASAEPTARATSSSPAFSRSHSTGPPPASRTRSALAGSRISDRTSSPPSLRSRVSSRAIFPEPPAIATFMPARALLGPRCGLEHAEQLAHAADEQALLVDLDPGAGRGVEDHVVAGMHRHADADVLPPVEARADREHDPLLRRRVVAAGRDHEAGAPHPVGVELLDHD